MTTTPAITLAPRTPQVRAQIAEGLRDIARRWHLDGRHEFADVIEAEASRMEQGAQPDWEQPA